MFRGDRGGDQLTGSDGGDILDGGPGNDPVIDGSLGNDTLIGGGGNDGQPGSFDQFGSAIFPNFTGGDGNDIINEGSSTSGADDMSGGEGIDTIDYAARSIRVIVNLRQDLDFFTGEGEDANLDDMGEEGDTIHSDIESARGGPGSDFLAGGFRLANVITGNKGSDAIEGNGGGDTLRGGEDPDIIFSNDGVSTDSVTCGPSLNDEAQVDALDLVATDCENVF